MSGERIDEVAALCLPFESGLVVSSVSRPLAGRVVEKYHYLHRKPQIRYAYGLWNNGELVGVLTLGLPPSRYTQLSACPSDPTRVLELNRLWVSDSMPRNTESWFVSRALKLAPPAIIISYSDLAYGHYGYVYRACNFNYAGWTTMNSKTPRYDYVIPGWHSRESFRCKVGDWAIKVARSIKVRYWTTTGNRRERAYLASICGWPVYNWKELPPPGSGEACSCEGSTDDVEVGHSA